MQLARSRRLRWLHIVGEVRLLVNHCLLGLPGVRKEELKRVLSHPQALDQCEMTLSKFGIVKVSADNTAGAAQDNSDNVTRFLILAREPMIPRTDRLHKISLTEDNQYCQEINRKIIWLTDQTPLHINLGKYIATNVPSLKGFSEEPTCQQQGISTLQAISTVMFQLLSYEFKTNYEGWINEVKPNFVSDVADCVTAAITSIPKNIKLLSLICLAFLL
nr:arogenate dehydratase/prephenate dehydratase 1, chloroplastic isoform X2 [Ipomoea batatas]